MRICISRMGRPIRQMQTATRRVTRYLAREADARLRGLGIASLRYLAMKAALKRMVVEAGCAPSIVASASDVANDDIEMDLQVWCAWGNVM